MPVGGSGSIGEQTSYGVALDPVSTSVDRGIEPLPSSRGPLGKALLFDGRYSSVPREPNLTIGIVDDSKNLIGRQTLLGAYGSDLPLLKPTETTRRPDPQVTFAVNEGRINVG